MSVQFLGRFSKDQLFIILLALMKHRQIHPPVRFICGLLCCILEHDILCIFCRIKSNLKEALNNELP